MSGDGDRLTGVLRFNGATIFYEITGEKVRAHEVGTNVEIRSPELLEAIRADVEHQRVKQERP